MDKTKGTEFHEEQFLLAYPDGIENHFWESARNSIVAHEIRMMGQATSKILEVGCGRGVVVKYLRSEGLNCSGIELSAVRPAEGTSLYMRTGLRAEELPLDERESYQVILLLDVIEHVYDPICFLKSLIQAFPQASHFLISVPARPELWSNYDTFYGHFRRYDFPMLHQLAQSTGWMLLRMRHLFQLFYLPGILLRVTGRSRPVQSYAPEGINVLLHKILALSLFLEYKTLPGRIPGTSIIAWLRRP